MSMKRFSDETSYQIEDDTKQSNIDDKITEKQRSNVGTKETQRLIGLAEEQEKKPRKIMS